MPIKVYKRGNTWHYRGTVAGRRLRGSCQTQDRRTAERIAAEIEQRQWTAHLDGPGAVLTFAQAAILYRSSGRPKRFLAPVEDYFKDTLIKDISPGLIRKAAIERYPDHLPSTRNRQFIVPTQAIINHAADLELCQRIRVKRFPVERRHKPHATWQWVQAFMSSANPNLGALACFLFLTGARISEAVNVTWADVDLTKATALIRQTKTGSERVAHLPPPLVAAMARIQDDRKPARRVFHYSSRETARVQWNKAIRRGQLQPLSFHRCRHGFATGLLHAGIDPITVAKLGGWKGPRHVFETYGHAREEATLADILTQSGHSDTKAAPAKPQRSAKN